MSCWQARRIDIKTLADGSYLLFVPELTAVESHPVGRRIDGHLAACQLRSALIGLIGPQSAEKGVPRQSSGRPFLSYPLSPPPLQQDDPAIIAPAPSNWWSSVSAGIQVPATEAKLVVFHKDSREASLESFFLPQRIAMSASAGLSSREPTLQALSQGPRFESRQSRPATAPWYRWFLWPCSGPGRSIRSAQCYAG